MSEKVFRKKSMERISSPEQLNDYIKVSNPSIWIILGAVFALAAAVVVWSITGSLPSIVTAYGVAGENQIVCYVPQAAAEDLKPGMEVKVGGLKGKITRVAAVPLSYQEAVAELGADYYAYTLRLSEWNWKVEIQVESPLDKGAVYAASITTDNVRPLEFLFN